MNKLNLKTNDKNGNHHLNGKEIEFLIPIVKSKEFAEFAKSHSKEEIRDYLDLKIKEFNKETAINLEKLTDVEDLVIPEEVGREYLRK